MIKNIGFTLLLVGALGTLTSANISTLLVCGTVTGIGYLLSKERDTQYD